MNEPGNIENTTTDKRRKRRNKKIFLLFLITGITAIVLVGTTYAWFVGLGDVVVNTFNISISAGKDIQISLDGYTWGDNVAINETTIQAKPSSGSANGALAYTGSKNKWVGTAGLDPVSSSGQNVKGRLQFFSKTSLTATGGGYRLIADQVTNDYTGEESDKYVTFDIFIKNGTAETYNPAYNVNDDEALYLTSDSKVVGQSAGGGSSGYGVQNSVRVAFVQIGRIAIKSLTANTTPEIKCEGNSPVVGTDSGGGKYTYTSLCDQASNPYQTVIWEPNNTTHSSNLSSYYTRVCRAKTVSGSNISYATDGTTGACTALNSADFKTYTVAKAISSADNVDVYDGLNSYTASISTGAAAIGTLPLAQFPTFTDTMKTVTGTARKEFMKIAPNSVTKIRVYVYLEGQDVDNYDLISKDTGISVGFGFTKAQLDMENPGA